MATLLMKYTLVKERALYDQITWAYAPPNGEIDMAGLQDMADYFGSHGGPNGGDVHKLVDDRFRAAALKAIGAGSAIARYYRADKIRGGIHDREEGSVSGGRQPFEGMLVYDDGATGKRPAIFMQPDGRACAPTPSPRRASSPARICRDDGRHVRRRLWRQAEDPGRADGGLGRAPTRISPSRCPAAARPMRRSSRRRASSASSIRPRGRRSVIAPAAALRSSRPAPARTSKGSWVFHVTHPNPVQANTACNIKGRVLAIHGSADPVTPKPAMDALQDELTAAKVDWQVMTFGGRGSFFCDPTVHAGPTRYDEKLCRKSYAMMRDFFARSC